MKTSFKIALAMLALVVGAPLGQAHKHIRMANAEARRAQERLARAQVQSDKDAQDAQTCRDMGGMPIYSIIGRLAGCSPLPKK